MQEIPAMTQDNLVANLRRMNTIHQRIKSLRETLGLSMEQLAERVSVSWQTVQQWENGKTAPKRARLEAVAEALGTSAEYLAVGQPPAPHDATPGSHAIASPWPFPSIPEERVRKLSPSQLNKLEGAIALALGQLDIGLEVAKTPASGSLYSLEPARDEFPMRIPGLPAPWEGGKTTKQMEREGSLRFDSSVPVAANVVAGEPQAANDRFEKVAELADVRLAAGEGIENHTEEQTGFVQFRRSFLRSVGADGGRGRVVYAKGDSMEPLIRDGAALLVATDAGLALQDLTQGAVYAINFGGKMLVKTVLKDRLTGRWVARSVNPRYPDIPLEGEASVRVLGKVVWAGARLDEAGQWVQAVGK
ncbi:XRE family transcriptional regulator [Bordetella hinzii]|uniref:XRE family transcriptional regulator n=1 Tax=Bordetella hinzii TaxID=103855 RepID=UPI003F19D146